MIVKREIHITTRKENNSFIQMERNVIFITWETVMGITKWYVPTSLGERIKECILFKVMEM